MAVAQYSEAWKVAWRKSFLDESTFAPELVAQLDLGIVDKVCPNCGRAEKFSFYCSLCARPTKLEDLRIHPPGDTHGCVFKRVPSDARNGGWGDANAPKWMPGDP